METCEALRILGGAIKQLDGPPGDFDCEPSRLVLAIETILKERSRLRGILERAAQIPNILPKPDQLEIAPIVQALEPLREIGKEAAAAIADEKGESVTLDD